MNCIFQSKTAVGQFHCLYAMGLLLKGYFNARFSGPFAFKKIKKTTHNITLNVCGSINSEFQNFPVSGNGDDDSLVMYNPSANGYIQMV